MIPTTPQNTSSQGPSTDGRRTSRRYNLFHPFADVLCIHRGERGLALVMLLVFATLNAMVVAHYYDLFTPISKDHWGLFVKNFHMSGFDPVTYSVLTDWQEVYNVYRHPLLGYFMYPLYLLNQGLTAVMGINCALLIVAVMQTVLATYSSLFLYRTLHEVVGLVRRDATLVTLFFFSFAYILVTAMVPDHFNISLTILLLSIYVAGRRMKSGRPFKIWQTVVYFFLTSGTTLNNGLKVFLAALFVNRRRFFRPKFFLLAVILPSALIWGSARLTYHQLVLPKEILSHKRAAARKAKQARKDREQREAQRQRDSVLLAQGDTAAVIAAHQAIERAKPKKKAPRKKGAPITKNSEFLIWTDISTSRTASVVENLFGESIQLHRDHLLGDVNVDRPVIVPYQWTWNYIVEAALVLLFAVGVWCGRRSALMWLAMSYFGLDLLLHVGLGFAIDEIYIMTAHWAFAIPIAVAYVLRSPHGLLRKVGRMALIVLTAWLWIYNMTLIAGYLC